MHLWLLLLLAFDPADTARVTLRGPAGERIETSRQGRLSKWITGPESEAVQLFAPAPRSRNTKGDWNGEHAGKWLVAAARAAHRAGDTELAGRVKRVADFLVSTQEADGYLGTYAKGARFTDDAAYQQRRTWDIWVHAYVLLGLLEVNRYWPEARYVAAARKIGDLCLKTLESGKSVAYLGNHVGLSATILVDPAVELYFATKEPRYLKLARLVLDQAEAREELRFLTRVRGKADVAQIGDGKVYQLLWMFTGVAKLARATGEASYREMAVQAWEQTRRHHLTPGGGPWGGVGTFSEDFSAPGTFSPYGFVETCSTMAWMQLSRELYLQTGDARYVEEIEKAFFNDLAGAMAPNGEDWCYFVFPNGQRKLTYPWACCKSSGTVALEEYALTALGSDGRGLVVNQLGELEASLDLSFAGKTSVWLKSGYPHAGKLELRVAPQRVATFPVRIRIPEWARDARLPAGAKLEGGYAVIERAWHTGDVLTIELPMRPELIFQSAVTTQDSVREIARLDYFAIRRGPLVYATGLLDGYKREETLRLPGNVELREGEAHAIELRLPNRAPILFRPYAEVGRGEDGAWRLTWMQFVR